MPGPKYMEFFLFNRVDSIQGKKNVRQLERMASIYFPNANFEDRYLRLYPTVYISSKY